MSRKYSSGEYSRFQTSDEILEAIEIIAGDNILEANSEAYRLWADPTEDERDHVERAAWEGCGPDLEEGDELYWGATTLTWETFKG